MERVGRVVSPGPRFDNERLVVVRERPERLLQTNRGSRVREVSPIVTSYQHTTPIFQPVSSRGRRFSHRR